MKNTFHVSPHKILKTIIQKKGKTVQMNESGLLKLDLGNSDVWGMQCFCSVVSNSHAQKLV